MRYFIPILFVVTSCVNDTIDQPVDSISIHDVGKKIKGHWYLVWTETKSGSRTINHNLDNLEYYEFDGLKGINSEETDNHDGSFGITSCSPFCQLKRSGERTIIQYTGMAGEWESDILELSNDKLVLADPETETTWTYKRHKPEAW